MSSSKMRSYLHSTGKMHRGSTLAHILAASLVGLAAAVASLRHHRGRSRAAEPAKGPHPHHDRVVPGLDRTESGHLAKLESFSDYVARQLGFEDGRDCPRLSKLAIEYLKRTKGCEEDICDYFASEQDAESLRKKLIDEFERCILSYFAFHWSQASAMISQVLRAESETKTKLKDYVLAATRKQRFERVARELKVTRVISTLVEEMKLIGRPVRKGDESTKNVMVPVAHSQRSPVLLLIGGGAGAGKSALIKDILQQPLWVEAASNAVIVEIDAFKETDVIYKALDSNGCHDDMLHTAELVHQSSVDRASSLLVTALNEGRDVILDSTLSWEPFVEQTVAMARKVHRRRYRMGVGYKVAADGTITENYWEQVSEDEQDEQNPHRKPYRIELLGIVCDHYLAVVRGIRRAIIAGRVVRVNTQLKSHKRLADAFRRYCELMDSARLYRTNAMGGSPALIAWKDGSNKLLVDPEETECLATISKLNPDAESVDELYLDSGAIHEPGSVWNDVVLSPWRPPILSEGRIAVKKVENQLLSTETEKRTKLKDFVLAATRKKTSERVTKDLKVTRVFSTLVEEMKAIGGSSHKGDECVDVMVPVAHSQRSPVLLLVGGGMGAGKSTVLKDNLKQPFWAEAAAVVVEADAFKETDVIYKALNSKDRYDDMIQTAELVHRSSIDAACSLLVTALNEGRDVIMDGTLSWEPFVEQTVAMVRNVHKSRYRMGVGYKVDSDGTITENYWERIPDGEGDDGNEESIENGNDLNRKPYRIELVGVVCDAYLAVVRGIRRAITTGRAVRVKSQLKSHKRFADAFPRYCQLVDNARLYCTNVMDGSPSLMAWKDGANKLLVDPEEFKWLTALRNLNPEAESIYELYSDPSPIHEPNSVWNGILLSPSRANLLSQLVAVVKKIEDQRAKKVPVS